MILLDIPMPENCGDCVLRFADICWPVMGGSHTNRLEGFSGRPAWCPIKKGGAEIGKQKVETGEPVD